MMPREGQPKVHTVVVASQEYSSGCEPSDTRGNAGRIVALILAHRHWRNHVLNDALFANDIGLLQKSMLAWYCEARGGERERDIGDTV